MTGEPSGLNTVIVVRVLATGGHLVERGGLGDERRDLTGRGEDRVLGEGLRGARRSTDDTQLRPAPLSM